MATTTTTKAFIAALLLLLHRSVATTLHTDVIALQAIKASILASSIDPSSCVSSWDFSLDPCAPSSASKFICGFSCDDSKHRITSLQLDSAGYRGTISPAIASLSSLHSIDLSQNHFTGTIPVQLGHLGRSLQSLDLSANSLSGPVPAALASLTMLKRLDLSRNRLSGTLPGGLFAAMTSLERLHLEQNRLSGPLPPSLVNADSLRYLDASYNELSGESVLSSLPKSLLQISLRSNLFSGSIDVQKLHQVLVLDLSSNSFSGALGPAVFSLSSLQQFNVSRNHISSIVSPPSSLDVSSSSIVAFAASHNRIAGQLPAWFSKLPRLSALYLSNNLFSGPIPVEYAKKSAGTGAPGALPLARLFLDGNYLRGQLPALLNKSLPNLLSASFAYNCLTSCSPTLPFCHGSQRPQSECKAHYSTIQQ